MFTKEQALTTRAFHIQVNGSRTCKEWRVNGKPRTWKRTPERYEVSVKFGLYRFSVVTAPDANRPDVHVVEDCPFSK